MKARSSRLSTSATKTRKHETRPIRFSCLRAFVAMAMLVASLNGPTVRLKAQATPQQSQAATAQQQPVFRSGTRLVVETVSVKDKNGKPIEGLTAKDFTILEDGEP